MHWATGLQAFIITYIVIGQVSETLEAAAPESSKIETLRDLSNKFCMS